MKTIRLMNGPYHQRMVDDSGQAQIRMTIYETGKPVVGEATGHAIYEPTDDRRTAFWLDNFWEGSFEGEPGS